MCRSMMKEEVLQKVAERITSIQLDHPTRVGIDGVDASGKTHLADELGVYLTKKGYDVIRVFVDGFHNPKEVRYQKGRSSPEGYYYNTVFQPRRKQISDMVKRKRVKVFTTFAPDKTYYLQIRGTKGYSSTLYGRWSKLVKVRVDSADTGLFE